MTWTPRDGRRAGRRVAALGLAILPVLTACSGSSPATAAASPRIVVTYSVLGSVVKDLVGSAAQVTVLMPNGADPHEWSPSARDIDTLTHADLLVENGLGLEGGMGGAFDQAQKAGVRRFLASDHVTIRHVGQGEGIGTEDPDQQAGASDPHLWMDPLTIRDVAAALASTLKSDLGVDASPRATDLEERLVKLDADVRSTLAVVPTERRSLVTGHESLGYFAARYQFRLVGAIIPSLTSAAETSSADLANLESLIRAKKVPAIFTELGTSRAVADAVGRDTGAKVVELTTHALPNDGSYFTFLMNIAALVADNLK